MPERHALVVGINRYPFLDGQNLAGCVNDAKMIRELLIEHFEFAAERIEMLIDSDATRDGVLAAMARLENTLEPGDIAAFFFAGHGSRMAHPGRPGEMLECLVTHDSGRQGTGLTGAANRDILDREILGWTERLRTKTPHLTLIFDCCHSGSVSRDAFGEKGRAIEIDARSAEAMFGRRGPPEILASELADAPRADGIDRSATDSSNLVGNPSGWRFSPERAAVIAACRADEEAKEDKIRNERGGKTRYGALTLQLSQAMRPGATWREVFEQVSPRVNARFPDQHPQLEGQVNQILFATESRQPEPYLLVRGAEGGRVQLGGGIAQGVRVDSIWTLHPAGTLLPRLRQPSKPDAPHSTELARVRVTALLPTTCEAELLDAGEEAEAKASALGRLESGQRAFLLDQPLDSPRLTVAIRPPGEDARSATFQSLAQAIERNALLRLADLDAEPDALLCRVPKRHEVGRHDPYPGLGPLAQDHWIGLGRNGRLLTRIEPVDEATVGPGSLDRGAAALVEGLAKVARYRGIASIANPDPTSRLGGKIETEVLTVASHEEPPKTATLDPTYGIPVFRLGQQVDILVTNRSDRQVFVNILQLGADHAIEALVPFRHDADARGGRRLRPGDSFSVAKHLRQALGRSARQLPGLPMSLPEGFPWATLDGQASPVETLRLKIFITETEAHFGLFEQAATRKVGPPRSSSTHPLSELVRFYSSGTSERPATRSLTAFAEALDEKPSDWTVVDLVLGMRP